MELRRKGTAKALRVGRELKALRLAAGLSQADVTNQTGVSASQLTRIESGKSVPQSRTMTALLPTYGVRGAERDRLVALAARANDPAWLDAFGDNITERYANYISWEVDAREILNYEAALVPGLLQTEDYDRAIISSTMQVAAREVDVLVEVRRRRQEVLAKDAPATLSVVIDEAVLHRVVGSPALMAAQLVALAKESRPHVTVQVLPFGAGAHPGMLGSFCVLDDFSGMPLVAIESALNNVFLDEPDDVRRYVTMFEALRSRAMSPEDSAAVLTAAARKIKR